MRPSQYHYIKRAVTRTAYNRKMQKKRAKKRKKELMKKKGKKGSILFKRIQRKLLFNMILLDLKLQCLYWQKFSLEY